MCLKSNKQLRADKFSLRHNNKMAQRLQLLSETIKQTKYVDSSFDYLGYSTFLTPEENVSPFPLRPTE